MDIILVTNKRKTEMVSKIKQICGTVSEDHNLIYTGLDGSASVNRNYGMSKVVSDIYIMMDDDIEGFDDGWVEILVKPFNDENVAVVSARLINKNGANGHMMGDNRIYREGVYETKRSSYKNYMRIPTACIALRKDNNLQFDSGFIGSGYEDTDYMNRLSKLFPEKRAVINNHCKLIHHNEEKNQGEGYFQHNKKYYLSLYPDDHTAINQKDWTQRKR